MLFVELESEWANEPEFRADGDAGPADVARILRDIGLMEDNMQEGGTHGKEGGFPEARLFDL